MPSSFARVSLMTMTPAAPSLSGQALPAVTVPPCAKDGFEARELLERRAGARSVVLCDDLPLGRLTGISLARRSRSPGARRRALGSAVRTRPSPVARPARTRPRSLRSVPWQCRCRAGRLGRPGVRHLLRALLGAFDRDVKEWVHGPATVAAPLPKRETVSTPAEMKMSPSPARIACAAIRMVCNEEEQ